MNEHRFIDNYGKTLIVRHRRSAVLFHREADLSLTNAFERQGEPPYVAHEELNRTFTFDAETFRALADHLETVGASVWSTLDVRDVDSFSSDYGEYYDKPFDNNGYLRLHPGRNSLSIEAPNQPKSKDPVIRMYQFNKRRFESFLYDLRNDLKGRDDT